MTGLSVDADIDPEVDLFGKVVTELQEDVVVDNDAIEGTLKYATGYTGFDSDPDLQEGNYIVVHCEVPNVEDVTIKAGLVPSASGSDLTVLDEDGIIVLRVADKSTQIVKVVASKSGCEDVTKTFDISELVCEEAPGDG